MTNAEFTAEASIISMWIIDVFVGFWSYVISHVSDKIFLKTPYEEM